LNSNQNKPTIYSNTLDYDLVEDMKNTRENMYLYELNKLTYKKNKVIHALHFNFKKEKTTQNISSNVNVALIGDKSGSHTPPFLLTFEIFNRNVHNCLIDSGDSSIVMPYSVCKKLNIEPNKSFVQIVQLDRSNVKVLGELKNVLIKLSSNLEVLH
jgi:hypothetical protein